MKFNPEVIANKVKWLDRCLSEPDKIRSVLNRELKGTAYELKNLKRSWEPGGGASLFEIKTQNEKLFLKVKDSRLLVESKLEAEPEFSKIPSLRNEYEFLKKYPSPHLPEIKFYVEEGDYSFLALEWLDDFDEKVKRASLVEILDFWHQVENEIKRLFKENVVHTDIHEKNIRFRGDEIILCDFEEAREFVQTEISFHDSLDYIGKNKYGNVGHMPGEKESLNSFTSLRRLKKVFQTYLIKKLPGFLEKCRFDTSCSFNLDELQEEDARPYQPISIGALKISGHRPHFDSRLQAVRRILLKMNSQTKRPLTYLDIGCNSGLFSRKASFWKEVGHSIGTDGSKNFVTLAKTLAFLEDCQNTEFYKLESGRESMAEILSSVDFVSVLSVYHHIQNKDSFLEDLVRLKPQAVIFEWATQDRFYPERGNLNAEMNFVRDHLKFKNEAILFHSADYKRPLVLYSNLPVSKMEKIYFCGLEIFSRIAHFLNK